MFITVQFTFISTRNNLKIYWCQRLHTGLSKSKSRLVIRNDKRRQTLIPRNPCLRHLERRCHHHHYHQQVYSSTYSIPFILMPPLSLLLPAPPYRMCPNMNNVQPLGVTGTKKQSIAQKSARVCITLVFYCVYYCVFIVTISIILLFCHFTCMMCK